MAEAAEIDGCGVAGVEEREGFALLIRLSAVQRQSAKVKWSPSRRLGDPYSVFTRAGDSGRSSSVFCETLVKVVVVCIIDRRVHLKNAIVLRWEKM